jgi:tRNA modification GTPase
MPAPEAWPPSDRDGDRADDLVAWLATPSGRGAIALVHLTGPPQRLDAVLAEVAECGEARRVPEGGVRLRRIARIDEGLVVRPAAGHAFLMPHGGVPIVEAIRTRLDACGVRWLHHGGGGALDPQAAYPEAADGIEALALAAAARAASPIAIPLLLRQVERWRRDRSPCMSAESARSVRLDRLLDPPRVVVVGPPNAGKSSLANALAGRRVSIESELAGTTRDFTTVRLDLAGLLVEWFDTPGVRATEDPIEAEAIEIAAQAIAAADLVILLSAPGQTWAEDGRATAAPRLRVRSKADLDRVSLDPEPAGADLAISVRSGEGIETLVDAVRERLVPAADLEHPGRWCFDARLLDGAAGGAA